MPSSSGSPWPGLLAAGVAIGIAAHRLPGAERIAAAAERWPRIRDLASNLRGGLAVAGRPRTLAEALVLSLIAWSVTVLAFAAAGQAIGIQLTIGQAALLASGVALATAIPAGPANLGTFELAAVQIGKAVGVGRQLGVRPRPAGPRGDPCHHLGGRPGRAGTARLEARRAGGAGTRSLRGHLRRRPWTVRKARG